MIPIAKIKKDMLYSRDMADIIDVLKIISSSEFRNLSVKFKKEDFFEKYIKDSFEMLREALPGARDFSEKEELPEAFLLFCSDEGFLGEMNRLVIEAAIKRDRKAKHFIVIGERGSKILSEEGIEFKFFPGTGNNITMEKARDISGYIMELYMNGKIGSANAAYMKFISFTGHHLEVTKLLPPQETLGPDKTREKRYSETLIEPDPDSVREYLIAASMESAIYDILWSSKLSEFSIRVMHLEQSLEELKKINTRLKFNYFKAVHSLNDRNIREIFAARAII